MPGSVGHAPGKRTLHEKYYNSVGQGDVVGRGAKLYIRKWAQCHIARCDSASVFCRGGGNMRFAFFRIFRIFFRIFWAGPLV